MLRHKLAFAFINLLLKVISLRPVKLDFCFSEKRKKLSVSCSV